MSVVVRVRDLGKGKKVVEHKVKVVDAHKDGVSRSDSHNDIRGAHKSHKQP